MGRDGERILRRQRAQVSDFRKQTNFADWQVRTPVRCDPAGRLTLHVLLVVQHDDLCRS